MKWKSYIISLIIALSCINGFAQDTAADDDLFKKASLYFFQNKFTMAESLLKQVIEQDSSNVRAHAYLGDIYLTRKKYDSAMDMYKRIVQLDPENGPNHFRIGQVYYYKKNSDLAIENFQKSIELNSSLTIAYYHIGLSYLMLKRDKENTIINWETFLRKAPEDPQYDKIRRVIELLKDPNFKIPPHGSSVSVREALKIGGITIRDVKRRARDKSAGHETKKTKKKIEEIYLDDDL